MNFDTPTLTTKIAMATALMAGVTCGAQAAPVVFYDFEQGVDGTTFSNAVESLGTGISSATAWSIGAGTLQSRQGVDQSGAPAGTAILLGSWDENQFFEFKFTVEPDAVLTLTGLKFWERFTGTGSGGGGGSGSPQVFSNWNLLVNGIERASGAASAAAGVSDPYALTAQTLDVAGLTGEVQPSLDGFAGSQEASAQMASWPKSPRTRCCSSSLALTLKASASCITVSP